MPKYPIMLDKVSISVFIALCAICFALNGCTKAKDHPVDAQSKITTANNIPFEQNIDESVVDDPEEVEESDPIDYESDVAVTKVISVLGVKDRFAHSGCDTSTNKYKDYYVAGGDGYQILLTLSKPDTIVSIVNPSGYYTMSVVQDETSPTEVVVVHTGAPQPTYKARNIKWVITYQNGKTRNLYMKTIPLFTSNLYGSAEYHVNWIRWQADPQKFNLNQNMGNSNTSTIDASYTPTFLDIIHYSGNHYGIISNTPVQKSTIIGGIRRNVWVFKIRDRNVNCDFKAKTKTIKWFPSMKMPSTTGTRDSSITFYRSY